MNSPENAIEVKGLKKSYKNLEVLKGIDLAVKKGTMLALLGPNGAGKTTTVRILSTLLDYDGGTVFVHGFDLKKDAKKVRGVIGLTGQYAAVDEYLSGRENLEMMGRLYHLGKERSKTRAQELLAQFDLVDAAERAAKTYSGGMRRRLDLAASLVAMPPIIFLDEPTTGLDPRSRITMWEIIQKLKDDGATILLTTQYLEEADKLADEIAVIDHGKVIARGTPDQLKSNVGSERIEFTFCSKDDFTKALGVIGEGDVSSDESSRCVSLSTSGSVNEVKRLLDLLSTNNIEIDSLSMHKPTLDDVFLHLTGKDASDSDKKEETK